MPGMNLKDRIIQEIEALPEPRQADVLTFIRFLKIGMADERTVERRFAHALSRARTIAQERGITEADVDAEVQAVRSGQ